MERLFKQIEVPFKHLCFAMGQSIDDAKKHLETFMSSSGITINDYYSFLMTISKGKEQNTLYIMYGVLPHETKGDGIVQIVTLKHPHFISFQIALDEYMSIGDGTLNKEVDNYFKAQQLKRDMSQVYALIKNHGTYYEVLIPYKQ